jgi:hypothetical protein
LKQWSSNFVPILGGIEQRADSPRFTAALGRRRGPVDRGVGGLGVRGSGGRRGPPRQAGAYSQRGHRQDDAPP